MGLEELEDFHLSNEVREKLKDKQWVRGELRSGKSAQQILKISDEEMDLFYNGALTLFEGGKTTDAANAFLFLVTLTPTKYEYWLGLAMSLHLSLETESACHAYQMASLCQVDNPIPLFHLAKCLLTTSDREETMEALNLTIKTCGNRKEFQEIKVEAQKARKLLSQKTKWKKS